MSDWGRSTTRSWRAGKLSEADKKKINDAVSSIASWLDSNQSAEKEEFEEKQKTLGAIVTPILSSLGGGAPGGFPGGAGGFPSGFPGGAPGGPCPLKAADEGPKIEEID